MGVRHTKGCKSETESGSDKGVVDIDRINELLEEINGKKPVDGFTIKDYIEASNGELGRESARERLNKLIKAGKLKCTKCNVYGRAANIYQWVEEE